MKRTFFILILFIAAGFYDLHAQNFYVGLNTGYSFNSSTNNRILTNTVSSSTEWLDEYSIYENVNLSLGKGWSFGGVLGYSFNKFVSIELEGSYLSGGQTSSNLEYEGGYVNWDGVTVDTITYQGVGTKSMQSEMFRIIPSLVLSPGFNKFNPYMKMGVVFGFGTIYTEYSEVSNSSNNGKPSWSYSIVDNGGLAFGFTAAFGLNYSINEKISFFGEGNFIAMSYAPKKGTLIINNGEPEEIEYSDNATTDGDIFFIPGYPQYPNSLKKSHPFSSIGLKLGVKFNLY